jgi:hypothetical protein
MTNEEIKERAVHFVSRMSPWLHASELMKAEARAAELMRELVEKAYEEAAEVAENVGRHYADDDVGGACEEVARRIRGLKSDA